MQEASHTDRSAAATRSRFRFSIAIVAGLLVLGAAGCGEGTDEAEKGASEESRDTAASDTKGFSESGTLTVNGEEIEYEALGCTFGGGDSYEANVFGGVAVAQVFNLRISLNEFDTIELEITSVDDEGQPLARWHSRSRRSSDGWFPMGPALPDSHLFEFTIEDGRASGMVPVVQTMADGQEIDVRAAARGDEGDDELNRAEVELDLPVPQTGDECEY